MKYILTQLFVFQHTPHQNCFTYKLQNLIKSVFLVIILLLGGISCSFIGTSCKAVSGADQNKILTTFSIKFPSLDSTVKSYGRLRAVTTTCSAHFT
jgi:hypothetical protein